MGWRKPDPLDHLMQIRTHRDDWEWLTQAGRPHHLSRSEVIRQLIRWARVGEPPMFAADLAVPKPRKARRRAVRVRR